MRRLSLVALAFVPLAMLAPAASAKPDLPCDHWTQGCNVLSYLYVACSRVGLDCQNIH